MEEAATSIEPRIKGAAIKPFFEWYLGRWGRNRLLEVAREIAPALQVGFDLEDDLLGVLPSAWYPARNIHALLDGLLSRQTARERDETARDGARAIIDSTLKGVYRWLFTTMMTPERYARNAQKLFSRYQEPGEMTKTALGETGHLSVLRGWPGHHPLLCDFLIHTADYVYRQLGCRDVKVRRTACVAEGGTDCRFEITWSA